MSRCTCPIHSDGVITPKEFKERFKVGDIISSWSTDKAVKITAIGENRVLYLDHRNKERVASLRRAWVLAPKQEIQ